MSAKVDPRLAASAAADKLAPHVFGELAAIVGPRFISQDDHVTASHDWFGLGADPSSKTLLGKPPAAVVLPATTEEVAAIVKACNRHGIGFKAHSTGYGNYSGVATKGSVSIDLRRMNRIEILPEDRMAIIEPYATAGRLMAEANKHRLMTHMIGAGPIHSPLASATSFAGMGVAGNHTGNNSRNLLAAEWVTPEGEIVRIGSCGSQAGWFTGEGPGPGFRGIIRGIKGAAGALGVFTRIGYKLYPWAGPEQIEWTGQHPQRGIAPPPNFATYHLAWSNWQDHADATGLFLESKALTFITRTPPCAVGQMLAATNREYFDAHKAGSLPTIANAETQVGWTVTLMAWSPAELAWKEDVLRMILDRTDGSIVAITDSQRDILTANSLVSMYITRFNRMGDGAGVSLGILDSSRMIPQVVERSIEDIGDEQCRGGKFLQADTEQNWMWLTEGRHFWTENNPASTRTKAANIAAVMYFILGSFFRNEKKPLGITFFLGGPAYDLFGPKLRDAHEWMRQTKRMWDPANRSDGADYTPLVAPPEAKGAGLMRVVFARRWLKPLIVRMLALTFR